MEHTHTLALIRSGDPSAFPAPASVAWIEVGQTETRAGVHLRVRRILRRLSPSDRARTRAVWIPRAQEVSL